MQELVGLLSGLVLLVLCGRRSDVGALALVAYAVYLPVPIFATSINTLAGAELAVTFVTALLFLASATTYWRVNGRPALPRGSVAFVAIVAVMGLGTSTFHGIVTEDLLKSIAIPALWMSGLLVGSATVGNLRLMLQLGWVCVPSALLAIYGVATQSNVWLQAFGVDQFDAVIFASSGFRPTGSMTHPLVAGCVFALIAILVAPTKSRMSGPTTLLFVLASATTVSRSALIGLVAAGAIGLVTSERGRGFSALVRGSVVVVAVVAAIQLSSLSRIYQDRVFAGPGDQSVREAGYQYLATRASDDFGSLIFGGGYGHAEWIASQQGGVVALFQTFDNQMITWILDYGLLTLVGAVAALGTGMLRSVNGRRVAPAIVAGLIMMQFANLMQFIPFAVVFGVALGAIGPKAIGAHPRVAVSSRPDRLSSGARHASTRRRLSRETGADLT
jgi:hypothetical protein